MVWVEIQSRYLKFLNFVYRTIKKKTNKAKEKNIKAELYTLAKAISCHIITLEQELLNIKLLILLNDIYITCQINLNLKQSC